MGTSTMKFSEGIIATGSVGQMSTPDSEDAAIHSSGSIMLSSESDVTGIDIEVQAQRPRLKLSSHTGGSYNSAIIFDKFNDTGDGSLSAVVDNMTLSQIDSNGYDGSVLKNATSIRAVVDGATGNADMPGRLEFRTSPDGTASVVTRMTIKHDGKVGIGTTSPVADLDISGSMRVVEDVELVGSSLVVSGTITGRYDSAIPGNALMFKNTEHYFVTTDDDVANKTMAPDENTFFSGSIGSKNTSTKGTAVFGGDLVVSGNHYVEGTITTTNDISFQDNGGTFPTNTAGFFWDLNNDEARVYAKQPASDEIDFVFKLSDNNNNVDRYVFWIDDYRGGSYDRYPLVMHGSNVFFHMTETSEGVPNTGTAKVRINSNGHIALKATQNPSTTADYAHIYAKDSGGSAEVFVRDEAGNVTQISPHNEEGEWQYFSKNTKTGKVVKINMEKMIRKLEEITGESFMEEWYEDL